MESDSISFDKLDMLELPCAMDILNQEPFASKDNESTKTTDIDWLKQLVEFGHSYKLTLNNNIVGVVFAENLIGDGVLLWLIATSPEVHNMRLGSKLLSSFENEMKSIGKTWIFLNSTEDAMNFYRKNNYQLKPNLDCECFKTL